MSIETTSTFNLTATQIITRALLLLGIYSPNDTLATNDFNVCLDFLNMLVKHWEGLGIHVWTTSRATLWLQPNQSSYSLGANSTDDNWANAFVETTLVNAASKSATSIVVAANTSSDKNSSLSQIINVSDNIGIVLSTGAVQWTTVSSSTIVGTGPNYTIGLGASLTASANAGAYVYDYTARPVKPLEVKSAVRRSGLGTSSSDVLMPAISFYDYEQLTNKSATGTPLQWKYTPGTGSGELKLWLVPTDATQRVHFEYLRPMFDFVSSSDNPDLPQEWLLTLVYNLAVLIAPAYGKSQMVQELGPMASSMLLEIDGYDREKKSLYLGASKYRY